MVDPASGRLFGAQSMIDPLRRVLVHRPASEYTAEAFRAYGLDGTPDLAKAQEQHDAFTKLLDEAGVAVEWLDEHTSVQTSATYDPVLVTNQGAILLQSGRPERRVEMSPMARKMVELEIPIIGWMRGDGYMDGGDTLWLDHDTLLVARGYRTNEEGVRQLRAILDPAISIIEFDNPHFRGPEHVIHLMSYVSLVSEDVAVVYAPLMPVRLRTLLEQRNYRFVEVPDTEFLTEGCNVLCLEPKKVLSVRGNDATAAQLRNEGIEVTEFDGDEVCLRRISGPTCNTRPLLRS